MGRPREGDRCEGGTGPRGGAVCEPPCGGGDPGSHGSGCGSGGSCPGGRRGAGRFCGNGPKKPRSVAQCAATLRLTSGNALRCERGEIGGDITKARKAVATAMGNYATACKAAGVPVDGDLEADAKYAAGFDDLADDAALGE